MQDPDYTFLTLTLQDRFADHGLVSVLGARRQGEMLEIDIWVMSCRVIGRTVEDTMLAQVVEIARREDCTRVRGVYRRSAKNAMVADLYPRLGFQPRSVPDPKHGIFELDIGAWQIRQLHIEAVTD